MTKKKDIEKQEEEEGKDLCSKCGNIIIEEDGKKICSHCIDEIDYFGDNEPPEEELAKEEKNRSK